jgi:Protein of unknown function (DUF5818)
MCFDPQVGVSGEKQGGHVKKLALTLVGTLIFLMVACSQQPASTESTAPSEETQSAAPESAVETFMGEIMDSACAAMGSHEQMMKSEGAKNAKDCTLECVKKMGSKFVLYNPATKTTYQLDDQTKPERFAGEKVDVTGTLDSATGTIHVESIAAA